MGHQFIKGKTNNHLTFAMVDATDFATPESALSAAAKIMIYGKLAGSSSINFVSSGTGSMAGGDIKHVGASATGIYTVALVKADLSDASAAWYDQYTCIITGTGAAQQVIVVDGGIWISDLSAIASDIRSDVSDMHSDLLVMSGIQSDILSAVLLTQSLASDAHSAAVVAQSISASDMSDLRSAITAVTATVSASDISDIASAVWATAIGTKTVTITASDMSDIRSAIAAGPAATVTASDISDIASAVWANTIGARVDSRILVAQSLLSDIRSDVSDMHSDLLVMSGILSDAYSLLAIVNSDVSDLTSRITGAVATASDVASKVWAEKYTAAGNVGASTFGSLARIVMSRVSDVQSQITAGVSLDASTMSDIRSAISAGPAGAVTASDISDIASRVEAVLASNFSDILSAAQQTNSRVLVVQSRVSDLQSHLSDLQSDFQSRVPKLVATNSQLSDLASDVKSAVIVNTSTLSDIYSLLSDVSSDLAVLSGIVSDINSAVTSVGFKKNTAITDFEFLMVNSTDHITPQTGLTVSATRSLDGAAFGACANAVAELSNGIYVIDLAAGDLNANIVTFRFTAVGADDRYVTIKTQP